jgi:DNA-binding transcriptional LysR family regulator
MDTLEGMRVFTRVVQSGSLSAAGRALGMSSASVSRKISTLEQSVGAKLLNRTSRKLALTMVGHAYFEKACSILEQIEAAAASITEQQAAPRGVLNVHTRSSIGNAFLFQALPAFQLRYPDITVNLSLSEETASLIDHKIDVAIQIGPPDEPSLTMRRLSSGVERVLYASPTYLSGRPEIRTPQDLLQHNCLSFPVQGGLEDGQAVWYYRDAEGAKELRVKGSLVANDAQALRSAVLAGIGITLMPAWLVSDDLGFGRVRRILPQYEFTATVFDHAIYAVFTERQLMMPKVRVFVDFLVDIFRKQAPDLARMTMDVRKHSIDSAPRPPDALRWISRI